MRRRVLALVGVIAALGLMMPERIVGQSTKPNIVFFLIDDFDAATRREAVRRAAGRIPLEVSGGVDMETVRAITEDGVECISIGGLTKHVRAIDLSLKLGRRG